MSIFYFILLLLKNKFVQFNESVNLKHKNNAYSLSKFHLKTSITQINNSYDMPQLAFMLVSLHFGV